MLVILEGPDGVGKDTAAQGLMSYLQSNHGLTVHIAPEPSKESLGLHFRDTVLCPSNAVQTSPTLDALVLLASRRENYERFIPRLLSEYDVVILTRNWMSLEAYQLWDTAPAIKELLYRINTELTSDIDLGCDIIQCLLYCEFDVAYQRMLNRGEFDRMESRGKDFMQRVNANYAEFIGHLDVHVIDAKQSKAQVAIDVYETVMKEMTRVQK